jgi:serine/threonine protein kinase
VTAPPPRPEPRAGVKAPGAPEPLTPLPRELGAFAAALGVRYAIQRELRRGGMATVYLARDLKHERLVALKVLDPQLAPSWGPLEPPLQRA